MADLQDLVKVVLALRAANAQAPARQLLDAVMSVEPWCDLKRDPDQRLDLSVLDARGSLAEVLREALAPEVEPDFVSLLDDADPEVREVFKDLWHRAVVSRFGRAYLGWV